ncbi:MAG: hypothetical protein AAGJ81_15695 [Verrucomicrobiota bacterium]
MGRIVRGEILFCGKSKRESLCNGVEEAEASKWYFAEQFDGFVHSV